MRGNGGAKNAHVKRDYKRPTVLHEEEKEKPRRLHEPSPPAAKERKNESSETSQSLTIKTYRIASVFGPEHFLFHRVPTVGEQNHPGDAEGE